MGDRDPPLSELLSAAFVAFVVEADNAAEQRISHYTTLHKAAGNRRTVWLTSLAMYFNCLLWLPEEGLTVAELERRSRLGTNRDGMRRWGYVRVEPTPSRPDDIGPDSRFIPTLRGRAAAAAWRRVPSEIEDRWRGRFGTEAVDRLRATLLAVVTEIETELPDYLPILGYGLFCRRVGPADQELPARDPAQRARDPELPLISLLARVLLRLALDYEDGVRVSLAVQSNALGLIGDDGVAIGELPRRAGASKEAMAVAVGFLERAGCVVLEPLPGRSRGRQARLTDRGVRARAAGIRRLAVTEERLAHRHAGVAQLRAALAPLVGDGTRDGSPLFAGLDPPPESWRADVRPPDRLPRFPLVLHRGGYPDGA